MNQSHSLFADFATRHIMATLQTAQANSYLGDLPIKHPSADPVPDVLLYHRLRFLIERKFILNPSTDS